MPNYRFQCTCGVRFEQNRPMAKATEPVPCPACKRAAPRLPPEGLNATWNVSVTGAAPQNTGIHDVDTNVDRVVGQSAKQGWGVVERRTKDKRILLQANPDAAPQDISRNEDNTYRIMPKSEAVTKAIVSEAAHKAYQENTKDKKS